MISAKKTDSILSEIEYFCLSMICIISSLFPNQDSRVKILKS